MEFTSQSFTVSPIGFVESPFKEKFGVPRQPKLCQVTSTLKLIDKANTLDSVRDIEQHSHIWVLFQFHQNRDKGWQPLVRPPRLDGNKKVGVFATRSTFRPNQIGMSAVKLLQVTKVEGTICLQVEGLDLVHGTPIVDIKPYIPYSDVITNATSEFAPAAPTPELMVLFTETAEAICLLKKDSIPKLKAIIEQVLQQDPRPAYKKGTTDAKIYGIRLFDLNVRWQVTDNLCKVIEIEQLT